MNTGCLNFLMHVDGGAVRWLFLHIFLYITNTAHMRHRETYGSHVHSNSVDFFFFSKVPPRTPQNKHKLPFGKLFEGKTQLGRKKVRVSKMLLSDCSKCAGLHTPLGPWLLSPVHGTQGTRVWVSYISHGCGRMPNRNSLREGGFILVHSSRDVRCDG